MTKTTLLFLIILKTSFVFGQLNKSIELIDFSSSVCDNTYPIERQIRTRIVSQKYLNGISRIEIGIFENCSGVYNPTVELFNDTIRLFYEIGKPGGIETIIDTLENGEIIETIEQPISIDECRCCFQFTYSIKGLEDKEYVMALNNKIIEYSPYKFLLYPVEFELYKNDTINFKDQYGLKQGLWLKKSSDPELWFFYEDNYSPYQIQKSYYSNGNLKEEKIIVNFEIKEKREYYESGKKKSECKYDNQNELSKNCIFWDKGGKRIKNEH